jgi:hypothetical protein
MMFKFFVFLSLCTFVVALYFSLTQKTTIIFQTSCGAFFYTDTPRLDDGTSGFKYTPTTGKYYTAKDLALEMNTQAEAIDFPMTVTFQDGMFHISSPLLLRITDREYMATDDLVDGVYVGARYGEARRFLNHLMIVCEISYPPPYDPGQVFNRLHSTRNLANAFIGNDPIPPKPTAVSNGLNTTNSLLIDVIWSKPPNVTYTVGIYLQNKTAENPNVENWDLITDQGVNAYTVSNLTAGDTYLAGASFIGRYDESPPTMAVGSGVPIPIPGLPVFDMLAAGELNTTSREITPNDFVKILDMDGVTWPEELTQVSQIKSISIKFYSSIRSFGGRPSDARVTFGQDGPVLYYCYWRFSNRSEDDTSDTEEFPYSFVSTLFSPKGTTGPLDTPLDQDILVISDPGLISYLIPTLGAGPVDMYMWCGYSGSRLRINTGVPVIEKFELTYD